MKRIAPPPSAIRSRSRTTASTSRFLPNLNVTEPQTRYNAGRKRLDDRIALLRANSASRRLHTGYSLVIAGLLRADQVMGYFDRLALIKHRRVEFFKRPFVYGFHRSSGK